MQPLLSGMAGRTAASFHFRAESYPYVAQSSVGTNSASNLPGSGFKTVPWASSPCRRSLAFQVPWGLGTAKMAVVRGYETASGRSKKNPRIASNGGGGAQAIPGGDEQRRRGGMANCLHLGRNLCQSAKTGQYDFMTNVAGSSIPASMATSLKVDPATQVDLQ